jgi:hypothetical protein
MKLADLIGCDVMIIKNVAKAQDLFAKSHYFTLYQASVTRGVGLHL